MDSGTITTGLAVREASELPKQSTENEHPRADERFFFDTNGYLLVERFLPDDLVTDLVQAVARAIERRRQRQREGAAGEGKSRFTGANARLFGVLEDDPLFLDMMDYPPLMPYVRGLLNPEANYRASDAIWEVESPGHGPALAQGRARQWVRSAASQHTAPADKGGILSFGDVRAEPGQSDHRARLAPHNYRSTA